MAALECYQFPCLSDNYGVLVHDPDSGETASIDAPEAAAVEAALKKTGWPLTDIFVTHHHNDHVGGVSALKKAHGARVTGPDYDADRIQNLDRTVSEGDLVQLGSHAAHILYTPGHTSGHIAYIFGDDKLAFVGDTLFAMGCGRMFEGTPAQMWAALEKLSALDPETTVYCGHEYTLSNGRFALSVDGDNEALLVRISDVEAKRANGEPTVPTTIALELATNPFLRVNDPAIRERLGLLNAADQDVFAALRAAKDRF